MNKQELTVEHAIKQFYKKNNFADDGGKSENVGWIKFGFFSFPIPNPESRKKNLFIHDINHIATGFDTTWRGESAVSAWEIAAGGWGKYYFIWLIVLWAMGVGVVFYPKSTFLAFKKGQTMLNPAFLKYSKADFLKMEVLELQNKLVSNANSNRNPFVWMAVSFLVFISPFVLGSVLILAFF
jgi:hypothetical protein